MPIDFTNIQTTGPKAVAAGMISRLNDSLQALPIKQRAAILGSVNTEGTVPFVYSITGKYYVLGVGTVSSASLLND